MMTAAQFAHKWERCESFLNEELELLTRVVEELLAAHETAEEPTRQSAPLLLVERVKQWLDWVSHPRGEFRALDIPGWFEEALAAEETAVEQARREERERCTAILENSDYPWESLQEVVRKMQEAETDG